MAAIVLHVLRLEGHGDSSFDLNDISERSLFLFIIDDHFELRFKFGIDRIKLMFFQALVIGK